MKDNRRVYGFLHCHSEHSLKDSALKVKDLILGAKEMGASAVTLTDHGTCTGLIEFMNLGKEYGINTIPGVEAYMKSNYSKRDHLILIAKNYKGYQEISRAVSMANDSDHLEVLKVFNKTINFPTMDKEILSKCFGNGNVIATSACVGGVFASILLYNRRIGKQIEKKEKELSKCNSPYDETFIVNQARVKKLDEEIENMKTERNVLTSLAKKPYKKRLKGLEVLREDENSYQEAKSILEREMEESKEAAKKLPELKKRLANTKRKRTIINQKCNAAKKTHDRYRSISEEIKLLKAKMLSHEETMNRTREEMHWYKNLFGNDFYVEMQYHGIPDEVHVMPILADLAGEIGIPLVASNDIHMLKKEDAPARQLMRALMFEKYEEISSFDEELYMKDDNELREWLSRIIPLNAVEESMNNIIRICDACHVQIPDIQHYPKYRDDSGRECQNSAEVLRQKAEEGISRLFTDRAFTSEYQKRMEYELEIIISLGYADYLLIVADYVNYGKKLSQELGNGLGYGVGPGRGSGAGCLVNYLLGITMIDPLQYGLIFERFLNKDRVSMPDIDCDFSDEVRNRTIEYVRKKYGSSSVAVIRTCNTQGPKLAVKNAARFIGWKTPGKDDNSKARRKELQYLGEQISKEIPEGPKVHLCDHIDSLKTKYFDRDAHEILDRAIMVEGTMINLGVHAAGVIIGDGAPLYDYVPLLYNMQKGWAVQCDMVEAESINLLKMDFLGLINLDIITESMRRIYKNTGKKIEIDRIPYEYAVFSEIFSKGNTGSVFQFESAGMKQMLRKFKPSCFEDIVLLVAAYRPGPMDSIPDIIETKHGRKTPTYTVPAMEEILAPTYGYPIYQEQLMDIFHKCAGFTLGEADSVRKYMSKKIEDKFIAYKDKFVDGIIKSGADRESATALWDSLYSFSNYAFNKSHAVAYGFVSYQTGYLKYHYPAEYMCSVMNNAKIEKIPNLVHECSTMNLELLPPDINLSNIRFEDKDGTIRYGLSAIKGVSNNAANIVEERNTNGFYGSFKDFLQRTTVDTQVIEALIASGCFDSLERCGRRYLLMSYKNLLKDVKSIRKKHEQIESIEVKLTDKSVSASERKVYRHRKENFLVSLAKIETHFRSYNLNINSMDDITEILHEEKELLGGYISSHPLKAYSNIFNDSRLTHICDCLTGPGCYTGMITDLRIVNRKSDGKEMAFFKLEDLTGEIAVNCFTKEFAEYYRYIEEGKVVRILGVVNAESSQPEDEEKFSLTVRQIELCRLRQKPLFISIENSDVYCERLRPVLKEYCNPDGRQVIIHDMSCGNMIETGIYVSSDILTIRVEQCYMKVLNI